MATSAGVSRSPFVVTVAPRVCKCVLPPKELGVSGSLERAIKLASGYWNVYLAFFGSQQVWLEWLITDIRDGRIVWRNGRLTQEGNNGNKEQSGGNGGRHAA